jgi:hypothetical protein
MSQNLKYKTTVTPSDGGKQIVEVERLEVIVEKKWYHTIFGPSPTYVKDSTLMSFSLIIALTNLPGLFDSLKNVIGELATTLMIAGVFIGILACIMGLSMLATARIKSKDVRFVTFTKQEFIASLILSITIVILLISISFIVGLKLYYLFFTG